VGSHAARNQCEELLVERVQIEFVEAGSGNVLSPEFINRETGVRGLLNTSRLIGTNRTRRRSMGP
jgi:hypothetical protein